MDLNNSETATFEKERIDHLLQPTSNSYTNEWYRKQFLRLEHINKQLHSELIDVCHHARSLRKELHEAVQNRKADAAEIGRLTSIIEDQEQRLQTLEQRMDKASEKFAAMRREAVTSGN